MFLCVLHKYRIFAAERERKTSEEEGKRKKRKKEYGKQTTKGRKKEKIP
jgi:hypothetical protein